MQKTIMGSKDRGYDTLHPKYTEKLDKKEFYICNKCGSKFVSSLRIPQCGSCRGRDARMITTS